MNREHHPEPGSLLPLQGVHNLRDLGGYATQDGRRLRRGQLYRSGDLHHLSPQDQAALETRGIKTIVDFRGEKEKQEAPDRAVGTVDTTIELPIEAGNILELFATGAEVQGEVLMRELYSRMVESARPQYRTFFTILAEGGHTPLLFHCSAGKDRTGLAAAFILSALGVDRDRVYQDYLLSAEYLKPVIRQWIAAEPHLEAVMTIRREYLEAAFTRIDTDFGGIERYITEELKADVARLRSCYTEAVGV